MILYLDTSALVKLYVDEEHSKAVRHAVGNAQLVMCHVIAYAEARAALAKKHRVGDINIDTLTELKKELARDWPSFERI